MAKKKKGKQQAAAATRAAAAQEPAMFVFGIREGAIALGVLVLIGYLLPWVQAGINTFSGLDALLDWANINEPMRRALNQRVLTILFPLIGLTAIAFGGVGFAKSKAFEPLRMRVAAGYTLAVGGLLSSLILTLLMLTDAVRPFLSFGFWTTDISLLLIGLLGIWQLSILDKQDVPDDELVGRGPWMSAIWVAALAVILILNYRVVSFKVVKPAPDVLRELLNR